MTNPDSAVYFRPVNAPLAPGFSYADVDGDTLTVIPLQSSNLDGPVVSLTVSDLGGPASMFISTDHIEAFIDKLRVVAAAAAASTVRDAAAGSRAPE